MQQIESKSQQIVERRSNQRPWRATFDIWRLDSVDIPFVSNGICQGYVVDDHVQIDSTAYHLHTGELPEADTDEAHSYYHFALPVRDQWAQLEAQVGDYVFIRQQWQVDQQRMGIVWEPGNGWVAVGFKREQDGKIRFYHLHPEVIGDSDFTPRDPDDRLKGYIIALLKPEE